MKRLICFLGIVWLCIAAWSYTRVYGDVEPISNDEYSTAQWSFHNSGTYDFFEANRVLTFSSTPGIDIDIKDAWKIASTKGFASRPVIVAIIDTGVDYQHPDLAAHMWKNTAEIEGDGIDNDGNGYVDDIYGWDFYNNDNTICHYEQTSTKSSYTADESDSDDHGTHCAGIIAATKDNSIGVAGVASPVDVRIMSLKIHGGSAKTGAVSSAIKAIKYAEQMGADICNLSWGTYSYSASLYSAIEQSNMLFVCAAGNDGTNNDDNPMYPASFDLPNVISVGYTDIDGYLSYRSNYGPESVDLAVPSTNIYSTVVGGYAYMSGSSLAAPHVTGIAALLYSTSRGLDAPRIKHLITGSVKKLVQLHDKVSTGGIPSAALALSATGLLTPDTTKPILSVAKSFDKDKIVFTLNPVDSGSGVHCLRYFYGAKKLSDFCHGTAGTLINGNTLSVMKSGYYTFFVNDRAGNEFAKIVYVSDDTLAPSFADMAYTVAYDFSPLTIKGKISDSQSGVKHVKYLRGEKTAADFANAGTPIKVSSKGKLNFDVKIPGKYTLYSSDYRGNKSIYVIDAIIIRSRSLSLAKEKKTLAVGGTYKIKYTITPENTTDQLRFKSSNKDVATVSSNGKVTAVGKGAAVITVTSSSGRMATMEIKVR